MSAFRALSHFTLYGRCAARTSKCSTIRYVKGETAFWATYYMFRLRLHFISLSLNQPLREILKTFLEMFRRFKAEILTNFKTIKCHNLSVHENRLRKEKNSLGRGC